MSKYKNIKVNSDIFIYTVLILFSAACIIPLLAVISISISDDKSMSSFGFTLWPKMINFAAYRFIFRSPEKLVNAYSVSILVTAAGTLGGLLLNSLAAYALSRKEFKFKRSVTFFVYFSGLFNGGMVASYILIGQWLHLRNNLLVLILPGLMSVGSILILRTFMSNLPDSLVESSRIDGANEFYIYARIIMPLSIPALATVSLFSILGYWNDWWLCLLYIDQERLYNLQYLLQMMMSNMQFLTSSMNVPVDVNAADIPTESAKMAMMLLATIPMLLVFVGLQKYFVKGLTIGSVKG